MRPCYTSVHFSSDQNNCIRADPHQIRARCSGDAQFGVWYAMPGSASKTLFATQQDRPGAARKRRFWKKYQGTLALERLVFLDVTPAFTFALET